MKRSSSFIPSIIKKKVSNIAEQEEDSEMSASKSQDPYDYSLSTASVETSFDVSC